MINMNIYKKYSLDHKLNKNVMILFLAVFLSYIYVFFIPWELITGREFTDVNNYLNRMNDIYKYGSVEYNGVVSYITNEWLWAEILEFISSYTNEYRDGLLLISLISLSIYLYVAIKEIPIIFILFFVFNPIFVDLILSQVRMALAFSLLLSCIYVRNCLLLTLLLISSSLIHTASVLMILIFYSIYLFVERYGLVRKVYFFSFFLALIFSFFLEFGVSSVLSLLGDRRAEYSDVTSGSSVLYSSFWFLLAIILMMKSVIKEKEIYIVSFSIVMMCVFFFNSVLGVYGQRFVAVSIIPILISVMTLPVFTRLIILITFFLYQFFQYIYWVNISLI